MSKKVDLMLPVNSDDTEEGKIVDRSLFEFESTADQNNLL